MVSEIYVKIMYQAAMEAYNEMDKTYALNDVSVARIIGRIIAYENVLEIEPKTFG